MEIPNVGSIEESANSRLYDQFAERVLAYERSARWMLNPELIKAGRMAIGPAEPERDRALDLCCGTGIIGRNLLDLGWSVKGVDLAPEMGFVASEYFPVKIGSVERMGFPDASFDLAILRQSFMFLNGPRALSEIRRVLRPGGRLVMIQSIAFSGLDNVVYAKVQGAAPDPRTYYRHEDLTASVGRHGFTVLERRELAVRESVDQWLRRASDLTEERRRCLRDLISNANETYKRARRVEEIDGELFEDWNWLVLVGQRDGP